MLHYAIHTFSIIINQSNGSDFSLLSFLCVPVLKDNLNCMLKGEGHRGRAPYVSAIYSSVWHSNCVIMFVLSLIIIKIYIVIKS